MIHRVPYEMGGFYFSLNVVTSMAGCWLAAWLYIAHYNGHNKIAAETIFTFLGILLATWFIFVTLFFYKIKRRFWSTFYSTRTGCQETIAYFKEHEDDERKSLVFGSHTDLWKDIEDDVMKWTLENWARWERENPVWFTESWKEKVPDRMIPKPALDQLNVKAGGERRRSSIFKSGAPPEGLNLQQYGK